MEDHVQDERFSTIKRRRGPGRPPSAETQFKAVTKAKEACNALRLGRVADYGNDPVRCVSCGEALPYAKRRNRFCSKSCAAKVNNVLKPKRQKVRRAACEMCGKEKTTLGQRRFCSQACAGQHRTREAEKVGLNPVVAARKLRKQLIATHGETCMDPECAWDFTRRKVRVELHHIDGDSLNNALSNVVLLCPGCHSLTETYGSRNMGNGRHHRRKTALLEAHGVAPA